MSEWFEDESFWGLLYPYMFSHEFTKHSDEQVEKILNLIPLEGNSVLDLCCGPGRISVEFAPHPLLLEQSDSEFETTRFGDRMD